MRVYPGAFKQSFAGLVHTMAHELGHVQQVIGGITSEAVREFLSDSIEVESKGMPESPVGSVADIQAIQTGGERGGFLNPAANVLEMVEQNDTSRKGS